MGEKRAVYLAAILIFAATLSSCGGGGGGGSAGPGASTGGGVVPPVTQSGQRKGDVSTVSAVSHGTGITYDSDDKVVVYDDVWNQIFSSVPTSRFNGMRAPLNGVTAMYYSALDHALYFASQGTLYKIDRASGTQSTVAQASGNITSIAQDGSGKLYVIEGDHISTVNATAVNSLTAAGTISAGVGLFAWATPAITYDSKDGNLYVADTGHDLIERVTTTGTMTAIAGTCEPQPLVFSGGLPGQCTYANIPGTGSAAAFGEPSGIAYDTANDLLYFGDGFQNNLWSVTPSGTASIVAGYGGCGAIPGNGLQAFLCDPFSLAIDQSDGVLYVREWVAAQHYIASYATSGASPPAYTPAIKKIPTTTFDAEVQYVATSPDNSAWVSEVVNNRVAHISADGSTITEYAVPAGYSHPTHIAVDASGNAWVGVGGGAPGIGIPGGPPAGATPAAIVRFDPSGNAGAYPLQMYQNQGGSINGITARQNGRVWFTHGFFGYGGTVGYVDTSTGNVSEYWLANTFNSPQPAAVEIGSDGNAWFGLPAPGATPWSVGHVTPSGTFMSLVSAPANAFAMAYNAADANIWFVDAGITVAKIDGSGHVTGYNTLSCGPGCADNPTAIAVTPAGTVWVTAENPGDIARLDASGNPTQFYLPQANPGVYGISARSDGKVWVVGIGYVYLVDPAAYDAQSLPHSLGHIAGP